VSVRAKTDLTVILNVDSPFSSVAVMVAVPSETAVNVPLLLTATTLLSLDDHDTDELPELLFTVKANAMLSPTFIVEGLLLKEIVSLLGVGLLLEEDDEPPDL